MSYPQQPGEYPADQPGQYPAAPPPPFPGGNEMTSQPSKGTTIAAAILAVLGAIWAVIIAISSFMLVSGATDATAPVPWVVWMQAIAYVVEVLALGGGAAALFMRKSIGRWLVTAGSVIHIIQGIIALIGFANANNLSDSEQVMTIGNRTFGLIIALLPAIATIILALLPPTARWLNWTPPQQQRFQG